MPANLSPAFTGVLLNLVTIVSSPMLLLASSHVNFKETVYVCNTDLPSHRSIVYISPPALHRTKHVPSLFVQESSPGSSQRYALLPRFSNFGIFLFRNNMATTDRRIHPLLWQCVPNHVLMYAPRHLVF